MLQLVDQNVSIMFQIVWPEQTANLKEIGLEKWPCSFPFGPLNKSLIQLIWPN